MVSHYYTEHTRMHPVTRKSSLSFLLSELYWTPFALIVLLKLGSAAYQIRGHVEPRPRRTGLLCLCSRSLSWCCFFPNQGAAVQPRLQFTAKIKSPPSHRDCGWIVKFPACWTSPPELWFPSSLLPCLQFVWNPVLIHVLPDLVFIYGVVCCISLALIRIS